MHVNFVHSLLGLSRTRTCATHHVVKIFHASPSLWITHTYIVQEEGYEAFERGSWKHIINAQCTESGGWWVEVYTNVGTVSLSSLRSCICVPVLERTMALFLQTS